MLFRTLAFFIIFCNLARAQTDQDFFPQLRGLRLPLEFVTRHYWMMSKDPEVAFLKKHILDSNASIDPDEAHLIAKNIIQIADCIEIDPWVLSALIETESSFDKLAISKTGAVGLTQFTNIGIKEVNDQLGIRGKIGAPTNITLYWSQNVHGCIDPDWVDLWERAEAKSGDPDFYPKQKAVLKKDIKLSITYGAILLKTYVALMLKKGPEIELMSQLYHRALQVYNGEPGEAKVKFANKVFLHLKNTYPEAVDFPFSLL